MTDNATTPELRSPDIYNQLPNFRQENNYTQQSAATDKGNILNPTINPTTEKTAVTNVSHKFVYLVLVTLVLIWGLGWPVIKISTQYCPPIWFVTIRLFAALLVVFPLLAFTKNLILPTRKDIPLLLSAGFLQIGLYTLFINIGLMYVPPGRSAILAYATPLIVTPIACIWFGEKLSPLKLIGLLLGLSGIVLLFSPWASNWHDYHVILGNCALLLAAVVWAIALLHFRFSTWHSSPLQLLPWQLLIATIPMVICAMIIEPHPTIIVNYSLIFCALYLGVLATAFGYWASMLIAKSLPVCTTSICFLSVPVLGLFSSMLILGEPLTVTISLAFGLILGGLFCVVRAK